MTLRSSLRLLFIAAAAAAVPIAASCASAQSTGYIHLFNSSLRGWVIENTEGGNIAIAEDVLRVQGPNGWLRSEQTYGDFRLRVEFKFLTDDADSGIFVRATNEEEFLNGWPNHSYQVQLRNPAGQSPFPPVGGLFRHGMPDGPTRYDPADAARLSLGTGEWQTLEIDAIGQTLAVRLNGQPLMEAEGIANPSGYIGVQGETGAIEIRAIMIDEL